MAPTKSEEILIKIGAVIQKTDDLAGVVKELTKEVRHNCEMSIAGDKEIGAKIDNKFDSHEKYHRENEHLWGIPKWFLKHSKWTIIIAILLGMFLSGILGFSAEKILGWYKTAKGF